MDGADADTCFAADVVDRDAEIATLGEQGQGCFENQVTRVRTGGEDDAHVGAADQNGRSNLLPRPACAQTIVAYDDALEKLMRHSFPGNVRELRNILLKAVTMSSHGIISAAHIHLGGHSSIPNHVPSEALTSDTAKTGMSSPRGSSIAELEAHHIAELLIRHNGHRRNVADLLGISERTLYRKLKHYNLA